MTGAYHDRTIADRGGRRRYERLLSRWDGLFLRLDLSFEAAFERILGYIQVVLSLQPHPEARRHVEKTRQAKGRVRRDGALPVHDLTDAPGGDAQRLGQLVLTQAQRLKKIQLENFAGVRGGIFRLSVMGKVSGNLRFQRNRHRRRAIRSKYATAG